MYLLLTIAPGQFKRQVAVCTDEELVAAWEDIEASLASLILRQKWLAFEHRMRAAQKAQVGAVDCKFLCPNCFLKTNLEDEHYSEPGAMFVCKRPSDEWCLRAGLD